MDPSPLRRWLTSRLLNRVIDPRRVARSHARAERRRGRGPHELHFFYQAGDPYSHLAAQTLPLLLERYPLVLKCYLVSGLRARNNPEPDMLPRLARRDATEVAAHYGLKMAGEPAALPAEEQCAVLAAQLAGLDGEAFVRAAVSGGEALFSGQLSRDPDSGEDAAAARIAAGDAQQARLGHYAGGMFFYGDDWYWGVDRLYHLENRWRELGLGGEAEVCFPRPASPEDFPCREGAGLRLSFFASLRSPYTAVVYERVLELCRAAGVALDLRPVLPMVMRGVSLTRRKGLYIFHDAAREARAAGVAFGPVYDPIGEPVRRCYSLYPWAEQQGRAEALMGAFLQAAFAQGVNTARERGLARVVEGAGLDWASARALPDDTEWQALLEANRHELYATGCWGVPSFCLRDAQGRVLLSTWGQDRLWLVARRIAHYQEEHPQ